MDLALINLNKSFILSSRVSKYFEFALNLTVVPCFLLILFFLEVSFLDMMPLENDIEYSFGSPLL